MSFERYTRAVARLAKSLILLCAILRGKTLRKRLCVCFAKDSVSRARGRGKEDSRGGYGTVLEEKDEKAFSTILFKGKQIIFPHMNGTSRKRIREYVDNFWFFFNICVNFGDEMRWLVMVNLFSLKFYNFWISFIEYQNNFNYQKFYR